MIVNYGGSGLCCMLVAARDHERGHRLAKLLSLQVMALDARLCCGNGEKITLGEMFGNLIDSDF